MNDGLGSNLEEYHTLQIQDDDFGSSWLSGIQFQRRRLQCFSAALNGREVWVFNLEATALGTHFYLATTISTLADIWGPVWRQKGDGETTLHYNVSGGSIIPWNNELNAHPLLDAGERLAHWVPYNLSDFALMPNNRNPWQRCASSPDGQDLDPDNVGSSPESLDLDMDFQELGTDPLAVYPGFSESYMPTSSPEPSNRSEVNSLGSKGTESEIDAAETRNNSSAIALYRFAAAHPFETQGPFLIGASMNPKLQEQKCRCSVSRLMHRLRETQRLHPLETSKLFYYVDNRTFAMNIGYYGCNAGAGIAIKKQDGRTCKQVLLEAWENQPTARDPRTLEHFWGVLVSKCNSSSRRTRLVELLGTDSMHQLLLPFPWSSECVKEGFLDATTSKTPFALSELWNREPGWQEELGKAMLTCLRALCQTGFDSSREEFYALWMSSKSTGPKRVVLKPSEHSWVRFLQDSEDACAMAVVIKDCLSTPYVSCDPEKCQNRRSVLSRLETALVINHQVDPYPDLSKVPQELVSDTTQWLNADRHWEYCWNVAGLKQNATFWTVPRGRLRLIEALTDTHLLLGYDTIKRDKIRQKIGAPIGEKLGHWEYTEDEDYPSVRPIPVHIRASG